MINFSRPERRIRLHLGPCQNWKVRILVRKEVHSVVLLSLKTRKRPVNRPIHSVDVHTQVNPTQLKVATSKSNRNAQYLDYRAVMFSKQSLGLNEVSFSCNRSLWHIVAIAA